MASGLSNAFAGVSGLAAILDGLEGRPPPTQKQKPMAIKRKLPKAAPAKAWTAQDWNGQGWRQAVGWGGHGRSMAAPTSSKCSLHQADCLLRAL